MSDPVVIDTSRLRGGRGVKARPKGRHVNAEALADVRRLLGDAPRERSLLIEHLHRIQDALGYLPASHLVALAQEMQLAMTEVYEVATFYHHFDIVDADETPPPPITIRVCETLSCKMAGADALREALVAHGDANVRVIGAPCIGRCEAAPAACVGQNAFGHATADAIRACVDSGKTRAEPVETLRYADYRARGGYTTWLECVSGKRDVESVLKTMDDSGLRGLGGAGFPAGRKWRIVRAEPAPRLMAVNIDEGEPGTFKDRHFLEHSPHRFLEGMLIAAWAVGIETIYVYLRDEYHACREMLERELAALKADPPAPLPAIHLRRGAGAYICGEESAMIESIEGKRGMPRLRPPYVAQVGLFGRPTLEHNMETLFLVRDLVAMGVEWFTRHGRHGRRGLRAFSVSGRVKKPGVHVAPAGITARELIDEYCGGMQDGHTFYGYLPGGASGGILPASLGDVPLDFDTLQPYGCFIGSAAIIVLSQRDRARDAALNLLEFFAEESCGQCTPCRVGTQKAVGLLRKAAWDKPLLDDLSQAMADASICGLGQAAPNPIACVYKYFPDELTTGSRGAGDKGQ